MRFICFHECVHFMVRCEQLSWKPRKITCMLLIKNELFFYFLQIYNLLYKLSNKQICYKETLVQSDHPMTILLYMLCIMLCVRLFFFLSLVL
jgi:hypothetical protein